MLTLINHAHHKQANLESCIMNRHISISIATPHVTIERYSELTGLSVETINDMLADGRLVRHRLRKDKKREKVMINIAAMTVDALSDCNVLIK
ncbi:Uncharacterised protein [Citrobacter freundii]|nr:Uncharacterised protein [Citrobacter freundii]